MSDESDTILSLQEDLHWSKQLLHESHKYVGLLEKVADAARKVLNAETDEAHDAAMGELEDAVYALPREPEE